MPRSRYFLQKKVFPVARNRDVLQRGGMLEIRHQRLI
nr:MAG TPA_asm: hypothetical protein [Caudoviricetes sp.]